MFLLPNDAVRAIGPKTLHDHGRTIAAQGGADSFVEFLEGHARVLLAGQQEQRAGVFLSANKVTNLVSPVADSFIHFTLGRGRWPETRVAHATASGHNDVV